MYQHITVNLPKSLTTRQRKYVKTQLNWTFDETDKVDLRFAESASIEVRGRDGYNPNEAQIAYTKMKVRQIIADARELDEP